MASSPIGLVVSISPVYKETPEQIMDFNEKAEEVRKALSKRGIMYQWCFLNDGMPKDRADALAAVYSVPVFHETNLGLATTLVEGYGAALKMGADLIARFDASEHDPLKLIEVVDQMCHSEVDAMFVPVVYSTQGEPRRRMVDVGVHITALFDALLPVDPEIMKTIYNQVFPLGFQVYRPEPLAKIVPQLRQGLEIFQRQNGKPATWGLDALSLMLTARATKRNIDFLFGGWATPDKVNRTPKHVADQAAKVDAMFKVYSELTGSVSHAHSIESIAT